MRCSEFRVGKLSGFQSSRMAFYRRSSAWPHNLNITFLRVQGFRGSGVPGSRVRVQARGFFRVQGFRGSGVQGFRGSGIRGFRGSGVQGFKD